jgi:hypothetical protein
MQGVERQLARLRPSAAVVFLSLVLVATAWHALGTFCLVGLCPQIAWVGGSVYSVGVARSLSVSPSDLTPYGPVTAVSPTYTVLFIDEDPGTFADNVAYQLDGVDPDQALVVRWGPEAPPDDAGSLGEYALLSRDLSAVWPALCRYFDPGSSSSPPECG